ncbi:MAG: hypothetical protein D6679_07090 [Candidatus Hydrogenedentota bacterium]|nr:MAG: hypothetical protein D6679_07090 [Candidatus Hydrogenedentota bacterium]
MPSSHEPLDYAAGLRREWYESDLFGNFGCGTVSGPSTSRGHGWFVVPESPERIRVFVNHCEEWVEVGGKEVSLTSTVYHDPTAPGEITVSPAGYRHLVDFAAAPHPRWIYNIEGYKIIRTIRPIEGQRGLLVEYSVIPANGSEAVLRVRPMLSGRLHNELQKERSDIEGKPSLSEGGQEFRLLPDIPPLFVRTPPFTEWIEQPYWYRNVRLVKSRTDKEDLFSPGEYRFPLRPDSGAWIFFSPRPIPTRLERTALRFYSIPELETNLPAQAVRRTAVYPPDGDAPSSDSSSPLFFSAHPAAVAPAEPEDALPALLAIHPFLEDDVLARFLRGIALLPSLPLDLDLLRFILLSEGVRRGLDLSDLLLSLPSPVDEILRNRRSTAALAENNLLEIRSAEESWWGRGEDAIPGRIGFPVDIQALWVNALGSAEIIARALRRDQTGSPNYSRAFVKAVDAIRRSFWDPKTDYPYDRLAPSTPRPRSNAAPFQPSRDITSAPLFLQSLRFDLLPPGRTRILLETVKNTLLSPGTHPEWDQLGYEYPRSLGIKPHAESPRTYPWLLLLWVRTWERYSDGKESPPRIDLSELERISEISASLQSGIPHLLPAFYQIPNEISEGGELLIEVGASSIAATAAIGVCSRSL